MNALNKETQSNLTPNAALNILKAGNKRFQENIKEERNLKMQVEQTANGQFPFGVVLSCIDSRVPVELVFDQGIGDLFSARVAGNIINEDVLGSIEYGCKVAGSKVIVVLGHTKCGAVTAASKAVELGNITSLLSKIKPAIEVVKSQNIEINQESVEKISVANVTVSMDRIRKESPILAEMEEKGEIIIVGAIYNVSNGVVEFL